MATKEVEEDSVQIIDNQKAKKLHGVSEILYKKYLNRDNPVFYDKKCKDYGNQVTTKRVFSPILVKLKIQSP